MKDIRNYLKVARFHHWIKQLFVLPGVVFAYFMVGINDWKKFIICFCLTMLSTCFIASANYVINEWLDAEFDKYHPTKKYRPVVTAGLKAKYIYLEYAILTVLGLVCGFFASRYVFYMELWLWVMGIVYNVKPLRTKEIVFVDVLSESINNAIRLLIGWFAVTSAFLPPISIVFGYWMGGAFLMAIKRYAEYRMIGDKTQAGLYRKSFQRYTEHSLLSSAIFYSQLSVFFCGIFLIKYKIELLLAIPFLCGLFIFYFNLSYKADSSVQKPEKLYKEKGLMIYLVIFIIIVAVLMFVEIKPLSDWFLGTSLIQN
ncbi:MAG: UbiA prenyltransferase family protein [Clostridia bacterium]|nr:UbiA prenyltransferase family protein [Clostridia bacterium]